MKMILCMLFSTFLFICTVINCFNLENNSETNSSTSTYTSYYNYVCAEDEEVTEVFLEDMISKSHATIEISGIAIEGVCILYEDRQVIWNPVENKPIPNTDCMLSSIVIGSRSKDIPFTVTLKEFWLILKQKQDKNFNYRLWHDKSPFGKTNRVRFDSSGFGTNNGPKWESHSEEGFYNEVFFFGSFSTSVTGETEYYLMSQSHIGVLM